MFTRKDSKCSLGHYMLQTFNGRGSSAGQVIGVRVVFPKALGSGTKSFSYSKYGAEAAPWFPGKARKDSGCFNLSGHCTA